MINGSTDNITVPVVAGIPVSRARHQIYPPKIIPHRTKGNPENKKSAIGEKSL
jgi:hypothetical protein